MAEWFERNIEEKPKRTIKLNKKVIYLTYFSYSIVGILLIKTMFTDDTFLKINVILAILLSIITMEVRIKNVIKNHKNGISRTN